jgi:hypothetical protein
MAAISLAQVSIEIRYWETVSEGNARRILISKFGKESITINQVPDMKSSLTAADIMQEAKDVRHFGIKILDSLRNQLGRYCSILRVLDPWTRIRSLCLSQKSFGLFN